MIGLKNKQLKERIEALTLEEKWRQLAAKKILPLLEEEKKRAFFPFEKALIDPEIPRVKELSKEKGLSDTQNIQLVFVNGKLQTSLKKLADEALLPKEIECLPFEEGLKKYGLFLESKLLASVKKEEDPLSLIHTALSQNAHFLYIPENCQVKNPLELLFYYEKPEKNQKMVSFPRTLLFLGKKAHLKLILSHVSASFFDPGIFSHHLFDIFLEEKAKLFTYETVELFHFSEKKRADLKKEALFESVRFDSDSSFHCRTEEIRLLEEKASVHLKGAAYLSEKNDLHQKIFVDHLAESTISEQNFKHVLHQKSCAHFDSKVLIRSQAQQSKSSQLHRSLLLSDQAKTFTSPQMEIQADDVDARHGATISQLDGEELFYLTSRGIEKSDAQKLLLAGFLQEIFEKIPISSVEKEAQIKIEEISKKKT